MTSIDFQQLAVVGVRGLQPYVTGKPESELRRELGLDQIIKLASNENPLGVSPRVLSAMPEVLADSARYPDGGGFRLKQALATHCQVQTDSITLGNGSNDILDIIARVFLQPGSEALMSRHAFAVYPLVTLAVGALPVFAEPTNGSNGPRYGHDLHALLALVSEKTRVVFIANPNNPTGTYLTADDLHQFLSALPWQVICVVDEAYFEYVEAEDYASMLNNLPSYPNLIVTRTFSKAYGLAGLRVGYSVSSVVIADLLNRVRQPFNVNSVALAAAEIALSDLDYLERSRQFNQAGLQQLEQGLKQLGYSVIPSVGNFVCFDLGCPAQPVYDALLQQGVIVRPVENYQLPGHIRVSVGTELENTIFLKALASFNDE